jgi:hypothetical protein
MTDSRAFPASLTAVSAVFFDYDDGRSVDYEPHPDFLSAEETGEWLRAWTRNPDVDGAEFRVFGEDGTGGYVALWLVRDGRPLEEQPVVFLGSEGETAHLAADLGSYLWLLAHGLGPCDALDTGVSHDPDRVIRPSDELTAIAERYAPGHRRPAKEILETAADGTPDIDEYVLELCG